MAGFYSAVDSLALAAPKLTSLVGDHAPSSDRHFPGSLTRGLQIVVGRSGEAVVLAEPRNASRTHLSYPFGSERVQDGQVLWRILRV